MGFDPYEEWLNLAPGPRPPDHYALLGVPSDESDLRRFHEASRDRYEHVQKYVLSSRGAEAKELLGKIGQAVGCLGDPRRRQQYDARRVRESVERWLTAASEPSDFYELLGKERFPRRSEYLLHAVAVARQTLGEARPGTAEARARVALWQQWLARAEAAFSDPTAFADHHGPMLAAWRDEYLRAYPGPLPNSADERLTQWLVREKNVHRDQARLVAEGVVADDDRSRSFALAIVYPSSAVGEATAEVEGDRTLSEVVVAEEAEPAVEAVPVEAVGEGPPPLPRRSPSIASRLAEQVREQPWLLAYPLLAVVALTLIGLAIQSVRSNRPETSVAVNTAPQPTDDSKAAEASEARVLDSLDEILKDEGQSEDAKPVEKPPQPEASESESPSQSAPPLEASAKPPDMSGHWSGRLQRLLSHQGELHLLVAGTPQNIEAVTSQTEFLDQIADYRSQEECGAGDEVVLWTSPRSSIGSQFRLDAAAQYLELRQVQRKDDAASLAVVGQTRRQPTSFRTDSDLTDLARVLYARPAVGQRATFTGFLASEVDASGLIFVSPDSAQQGYRVSVQLHELLRSQLSAQLTARKMSTAAEGRGKKLAVTGVVTKSSSGEFALGECLIGSTVESVEMLARLLSSGIKPPRAPDSTVAAPSKIPAPGVLTDDLETWHAICQDPNRHEGRRLKISGRYNGQVISRATIYLAEPFAGKAAMRDDLRVRYGDSPDAAAALGDYAPGDFVLLEVAVKGGWNEEGALQPGLMLHGISRIDRPMSPGASPFAPQPPIAAPIAPPIASRPEAPSPSRSQPTGGSVFSKKVHAASVRELAWSPDGSLLLTAGLDRQAILSDIGTGHQIAVLANMTSPVLSMAWDKSTGLLAMSKSTTEISIWDATRTSWWLQVPRIATTLGKHSGITRLTWRGDGGRLAISVTNGKMGITELLNATDRRPDPRDPTFENVGMVTGSAWHPVNDTYLALGDVGGILWIIDLRRRWALCGRVPNEAMVQKSLLEGNPNYKTKALLAKTKFVERQGGACGGLAWSPGGEQLAAAYETIELWNFTETEGLTWAGVAFDSDAATRQPWSAVAWHPGGQLLAGGGFRSSDTSSYSSRRTYGVSSTRYSSAANPGRVLIWKAAGGAPVSTLVCPGNVTCLAFSPKGDRLAVGCDDGSVIVWPWPLAEGGR